MVGAKKFINSPDTVVDESIRGLISANANLNVLQACKRVVIRADINICKRRNVILIAGGGSGHEPFAAGFVGKGLLSAAVCGNVFASPPTAHITAALEDLKSENGVIVFVINYTGDCLNFGLAIERFNAHRTKEGSARMVVISDDVALECREEGKGVGRRGLAGSVFIMKIAGAMAEQGTNADTIAEISQRINERIGTIGLSLSACSIPGKDLMFKLAVDEMELGLGIHGEPGCERTSMKTAKEIAHILMERLEKSEKKCLQRGKKIAILLNNLGGTSQIEMNIMAGEIISWLCEHDYVVARFYYGTLMTSLNGHGISVSALRIDEEQWIELLDAETEAPAWTVTRVVPGDGVQLKQVPYSEPSKFRIAEMGVALSDAETNRFKACIKSACSVIIAAKEELNHLDSLAGDGDCGNTLAQGAQRVLSSLESEKLCCSWPQTAFLQLSEIFEDDVGGTTGALYALMFSAASQRFGFSAAGEDWHAALRGGLQAIMRYGHAQPGDRSMVDPLNSAVYSIKTITYEKADWERLVQAAEKEAVATKDMRAKCGRASYTAASAQTEPDPGAIAVAKWIRAAFSAAYP
ncbi:Bifunctional ATP-dependent dihydroxyacetone kinase/FAD-AMP lyase (cyclizing) [Toxocara canis]|uniref:Triokinase/FMN cyclase n=1 Tax=Toxocara canis TaxID=6265 RepID=A0A0B2VND3_TOXCA|nr:Bifunctional ATP-dependent dihydroxyacetone kinase/FAD-AMP lyase (cyclizing) [Toxocara canis]